MSPFSLDNAGVHSLTKPERRGRALLLVIFIGWITLELVPVTLKILMHQLNGLPAVGVRICLTIALMYAVWIGWRWARWLVVGLVAITTLLCAAMLAAQPNLLMVVLTLIFLFTGSVLSFSRSVGSFLQFQRTKRDPNFLGTATSTISDGNLATCAECGGSFQKQEVIVHEGLQICPRCKPLFIQKVKEGVPVSAARGGRENSVDQSS